MTTNLAYVPSQYQGYVSQAAKQYNVPQPILAGLINVENGAWNPTLQAPNSSATGLGQFINSTAAQYGVNQTDPQSSINGAANYLSKLYQKTGSWVDALKSYGTLAPNPASGGSLTQNQLNLQSLASGYDSGNAGSSTGEVGNYTTDPATGQTLLDGIPVTTIGGNQAGGASSLSSLPSSISQLANQAAGGGTVVNPGKQTIGLVNEIQNAISAGFNNIGINVSSWIIRIGIFLVGLVLIGGALLLFARKDVQKIAFQAVKSGME